MTDDNRLDAIPLLALLRFARSTFGTAMRAALAEVDCDDMPPNGMFVIGAIARKGAPLSQIIKDLGVSKQTAGQLVDTLVLRGYIERTTDPADRRRLTVALTDRGRAAAAAQRATIERLEAELLTRVGKDYVAHTRATLAAMIAMGRAPSVEEGL